MSADELTELLTVLWTLGAALAGLAALALTVRLKLPQVLQLPAAFRALREDDPGAAGTVHPATSVALSAASSYGAAAAVGAATAIALGGPGAIAWVWIFSFFLAPLRMGEAVLARTAPAGQAGGSTGSLAGRLLGDSTPALRILGWALFALVPLAAFAFYGGTHGGAVMDAAEQLLPGSAMVLGAAVAGVGGALALLPTKRFASLLGWIAAVALIALLGAALVTLFSDLGRGFGGLGRALDDVIYDMPSVGAFSGALAGEIAIAAMLHLLPPLAAGGGVEGSWHAEAQAKTTKAQASAALLGALTYGLLTTVLGLALVATNAFARPVEGSRSVGEIRLYDAAFETVSQRDEESRRFNGIIRVIDGATGVVTIYAGTERGMIRAPHFEENGEPANVMFRVREGRIIEIQRPGTLGALEVAEPEAMQTVHVQGEMLPMGGQLLAAGVTRGGGSVTSRVALAALLLLAALGIAGWGFGVRRTLSSRLPDAQARFTAALPALGLGLAVSGTLESFSLVGSAIAALLTIVTSLALIAKSAEIAGLLGLRKTAPAASAPAEAEPEGGPKKKRKKRK
ncbi:MAG: alanine:cation symporter family protein [Sandaracinaceae bacterium]|nr:alanine:cation symporter family protein [Sandaracinaceae bacterium]